MKFWWQATLLVAGLAILWSGFSFVAPVSAQGQAQAPTAGKKAGEYFKNVTTSTLKELSVDDFLSSMGVISGALGFDCADCHPGAGTDQVDFATDSNPAKRRARQMIEMVANINRTNFAGVQRVTCFTCHHAREVPVTTIALDNLYNTPPREDDDVVPAAVGGPTVDETLNKYTEALGGAGRLATLTSFVATGTSIGYGEFGGDGDFTIYAKAPNQRTTLITFKDHPDRGASVWAFDGRTGWIKTPRGLLSEYELIGGELDGARLEAQLAFPGQIRQALNNWRSGQRRTIGNKDYIVLQGSGPRGLLATLYFDTQTGLLSRMVRYMPSPVGRAPIQIDYSDYRDVNGIKFPFEFRFSWLDGRYTAKIKDVKTNVTIDAARFGKP